MGRPPLPVGTFGKIETKEIPAGSGKWRARTRFRDYDGTARPVTKWGRTAAQAERQLKKALTERTGPDDGDLTPDMRVTALADRWLTEITADDDMAPNTKRVYSLAVANYLKPAMGQLRVREVKVATIDRALAAVKANHGQGAAKTAKTVYSLVFGYAVRHGALPANPVRDAARVSSKRRKTVRALTVEEDAQMMDALRADQRAVDLDLPDFVDWMLGTGMRIGEACAVRVGVNRDGEPLLDLEHRTFEVNGTVIREKGVGLYVQERPKTAAGWRVLALPDYVIGMLERRDGELRLSGPGGVVFPSPRGRLRDPSNTSGDLREALDRIGLGWVTSHTFRKTVATRLELAGFTPRQVADQLGHEKPSMTLDVYFGRKVVNAGAAAALDR